MLEQEMEEDKDLAKYEPEESEDTEVEESEEESEEEEEEEPMGGLLGKVLGKAKTIMIVQLGD